MTDGPEPGVRVVRCETVDELVEAVMGLAADDLAAGRTADADSAAALAAAYLPSAQRRDWGGP